MALFVDGPSPTIDDLTDQDSGLLEVAQTCGINVTTKIRLAHDEIEGDLQLWLNRPRQALEGVWGLAWRVGQIAVTPALKRWETMLALALVYRDAYFSQLADRYQGKWEEYSRLSRQAYEKLVASGIGLINDPLVAALPPAVASVAGPQKGGTFYASVAWLNAAGQEGAASSASSITIPDGNLMTVAAVNPPANAVGFNVYAGALLSGTFLQNAVALPIGGSFMYVTGSMGQGTLPGVGQKPDFMRPLARTLMRG
jgi:hypothetical protein